MDVGDGKFHKMYEVTWQHSTKLKKKIETVNQKDFNQATLWQLLFHN